MIGAGKYDSELTAVREQCGSTAAVLILGNGKKGPGFSCQATADHLLNLPHVLRDLADQIEADLKRFPPASVAPEVPEFLRKKPH